MPSAARGAGDTVRTPTTSAQQARFVVFSACAGFAGALGAPA